MWRRCHGRQLWSFASCLAVGCKERLDHAESSCLFLLLDQLNDVLVFQHVVFAYFLRVVFHGGAPHQCTGKKDWGKVRPHSIKAVIYDDLYSTSRRSLHYCWKSTSLQKRKVYTSYLQSYDLKPDNGILRHTLTHTHHRGPFFTVKIVLLGILAISSSFLNNN